MPRISDIYQDPYGQIYVLLFDTGELKIGQTQNFRGRLRELRTTYRHWSNPRREIVDGWYSHQHSDYHLNEIRLAAFCRENFGVPTGGLETFRGDFEATVAYAQKITGSREEIAA